MTAAFYFTVFTPTYNRKQTLTRVYDSLLAQTCRDFEWLIVDDGSTDGTGQAVKQWQQKRLFPIQYFHQTNGGKHRAHNRGVQAARGYLFLCLDSDDTCVPEALATFKEYWDAIPSKNKREFSGVTVHCMDRSGKRIGTRFPKNCMDLTPAELQLRYRIRGEKWGLHRTELLKAHPFPEIEGEKFMPEGLVWNRLGSTYKIRYVNRALRIYSPSSKGLDALSRRHRITSPKGARRYYQETLKTPSRSDVRVKNMLNYIAFSLHAGVGFSQLIHDAKNLPLALAMLPAGYLLYRYER